MRIHFDSNGQTGESRGKVEHMQIIGPNGHHLALDGRPIVFHIYETWRGPYVHFGRTSGRVSDHKTNTYNLLWDSVAVSDGIARRFVGYALRRGWQITECTADHPLRDILPDGWGRP